MNSVKQQQIAAIRFPIGAKLVVIISIISLLSLGAISALASWLMTEDIRVTAEDNNFTVNKRSAVEAEETLTGLRSDVNTLLNTLAAVAGGPGGQRRAELAASYFFDEHRNIAAVAAAGSNEMVLVNEAFFIANDLDLSLFNVFLEDAAASISRAVAGDAIIRNAAPVFGLSLLALFYPRQEEGAALALFSSEALSESFGTGANETYMVNGEADLLVHPNQDLINAGANWGNEEFVREMNESPQASRQRTYTGEGGLRFLGAYTKLSMGNAAVITSIEEDRVLEGVTATTRRNVYLTIGVLFVSGILIWLFSKTISIPMKALAAAARRIEGGQFEIELRSKTKDEIGLLTNSFQRMSAALGIFGRFTNREIAVRAMRGEIKPGGLPKHATIFFSDIRGFTEKSENFTKAFGAEASDKIVHWLNRYFTAMVECVEKTGGVVDKFIGDAVMAHWGTAYSAGSPEKDAFNCVKAALMMRAALYDMNKKRGAEDPGDPPIRIGCGINSGAVTAGQLGSEQRMEYTVIGDPVNLASRTEALNKPLGTDILITEDTWNLIGSHFITEEMPPVKVKGKEKPRAYVCRGKPDKLKRPQNPGAGTGTFGHRAAGHFQSRHQRRRKKIQNRRRLIMAGQEKGISRKDGLFIGICALGALCAFFFFWKDLNRTLVRINDDPIGIITYKYRAAQRRFVERVLWERLKTESPVYSGDTIRTSEQSEATVSLFDGSEIIDLKEKTLIQIRAGKTGTEIHLSGGAVAADVRSGSVGIRSGGASVSAGPGAVIEALSSAASSSPSSELVVQVLEGSAAVTQNGEQRSIAAGETITLAPSGEAAAVPARPAARLTVLSPQPQAKFLNNSVSPLPVTFSWNRRGFNAAEQVILEIAEDRNFNRPVHTLTDNVGAFSVSLPNGVYWWRAYPAGQTDAAERPGQIGGKVSVVYAPPPQLLGPPAEERFVFTTTRPGIRFQWRALSDVSAYLIEAAASPALNNPVFTATVQSAGGDTVSIVHSGFDPGTWYWRVTPMYQRNYAGAGIPSPVRAFTIVRSRELAVPETVERQETVYLEAEQRSCYFTWRKEDEAASYT
ncbi:MAG: HAMP domain-containing protein, partial [Treponema sp.]|nr:HAMP domain-containing protein [Treponema sp.]